MYHVDGVIAMPYKQRFCKVYTWNAFRRKVPWFLSKGDNAVTTLKLKVERERNTKLEDDKLRC